MIVFQLKNNFILPECVLLLPVFHVPFSFLNFELKCHNFKFQEIFLHAAFRSPYVLIIFNSGFCLFLSAVLLY